MDILTSKLKQEIKDYSIQNIGNESCGLVLDINNEFIFFPCSNSSYHPHNHCVLNPLDYIRAAKKGKILAHVHSQPSKSPSFIDSLNAINHNIYSIIYSWKYDCFSIIEPKLQDFLNKDFKLGENDCFSLVKNYYKKYLNIELNNYNRYEGWYKEMPDLINNVYKNEGFFQIEYKDIKKNDLIVFNMDNISQHLGIYLYSNLILHHPRNEQSTIDEITPQLRNKIQFILRHNQNEKNNLVKLKLWGDLGEKIGHEWELNVCSVKQAIRALNTITKNKFQDYFTKNKKLHFKYRILINGRDFTCTEKELNEKNWYKFNESEIVIKNNNLQTIDIVPFIESSDAVLKALTIVLGVVLIVVGAYLGNSALIFAGIALLGSGVIALLSKPPAFNYNQNLNNSVSQSYLFNGPTNTAAEGNPIPIGYGTILVGSSVISAGYKIVQFQTTETVITQ